MLNFVPPEFNIPEKMETERYRLRMLSIDDVEKDFEAVISSAKHVSKVWPDSDWPDGLTLKQNLIDLGWHEKEFQNRTSFAYTMVTLVNQKFWVAYIFTQQQNPIMMPKFLCGLEKVN